MKPVIDPACRGRRPSNGCSDSLGSELEWGPAREAARRVAPQASRPARASIRDARAAARCPPRRDRRGRRRPRGSGSGGNGGMAARGWAWAAAAALVGTAVARSARSARRDDQAGLTPGSRATPRVAPVTTVPEWTVPEWTAPEPRHAEPADNELDRAPGDVDLGRFDPPTPVAPVPDAAETTDIPMEAASATRPMRAVSEHALLGSPSPRPRPRPRPPEQPEPSPMTSELPQDATAITESILVVPESVDAEEGTPTDTAFDAEPADMEPVQQRPHPGSPSARETAALARKTSRARPRASRAPRRVAGRPPRGTGSSS